MVAWTILQKAMPPRKPDPAPPIPTAGEREKAVTGASLGLPMVDFVSAFQSLSASRSTWHSHEHHEVLLLLRGATSYEFEGGRQVELAGDQFMVIPPRLVHRGLNEVRMPSVLCGLCFDPHHPLTRGIPFTKEEMAWLATQFGNQPPGAQPMSAALRRMAQTLHQSFRHLPQPQPSPDAAAAMRLLVASIIVEAARHASVGRLPQTADAVALATAHMERHFDRPLQMNEVARHAGCSRARLFAVFKRETGMSPNDWLQRHRVKRAAELLAHTDRAITDIALSVGFSSSQYFSNVFRKYAGTTPGEHRLRG